MEVDMALVRRPGATGRAPVPGIPHQGGTAGAVPVPAGQENAAAVASVPAKAWAVVSGLGIAGVGAFLAWNIHQFGAPPVFRIGDTMSTFGALFVFSAATERVLEPFSRWMPGRTELERYERAVADLENGVPGAMNAAAHYKAAVDSARASRGILMWGIATFAATIFSASAGFYLLRMLSDNPSWNGVAPWTDALITGLVVGSGTKPVHDVIQRFQNSATSPQTPV
jgi:hypothetical protein